MAPKKPKTFDDLYPGRFLKAGNFDGKKVTLTIKDCDLEELEGDDGKKTKAIVSFEETPRMLVACKTNGLCMREMFGAELSAWRGRRVTLFPSEWNGEPCIRVWGSPELDREVDVEVKLPRRKPFRMRMHKTSAAKVPEHDADGVVDAGREPGEEG
jgi:hypothetical protein